MKIGVPGEFHEDRWQQTAEDSERCVIPRTREAGGAHRIQVIAWRRETSDWSSAGRPCPQVPQGHPRVAKREFWPVFGTAPMPTGTSVASSRGEGVFWTVFGTATMPTSTPVASSRGEGGLLTGLRHGHPTHRYLSAISAWRRGLLSALWHGDPQLKHFWGRIACRREGNRYR